MNSALNARLSKHPILLDGGLATTLEARGNDLSSDLWSAAILARHPDEIIATHRAFIDAGAEIITTSSYQASYPGFALAGITRDETTQILRSSVTLALEAAVDDGVLVAASVGPYGAVLANGAEYRGRYGISPSALKTFHQERLKVLIGSGADLVAFETMPDQIEVEVLLDLMAEDHPDMPFWVAYSCIDELHTSAGQSFAKAAQLAASSENCVAVGVNCTSPRFVTPLLQSAAKSVGKTPFVVYPNAGRTWDSVNKRWLDRGSDRFAANDVRAWLANGAKIIGGCCGIGPTGIAALRKAL